MAREADTAFGRREFGAAYGGYAKFLEFVEEHAVKGREIGDAVRKAQRRMRIAGLLDELGRRRAAARALSKDGRYGDAIAVYQRVIGRAEAEDTGPLRSVARRFLAGVRQDLEGVQNEVLLKKINAERDEARRLAKAGDLDGAIAAYGRLLSAHQHRRDSSGRIGSAIGRIKDDLQDAKATKYIKRIVAAFEESITLLEQGDVYGAKYSARLARRKVQDPAGILDAMVRILDDPEVQKSPTSLRGCLKRAMPDFRAWIRARAENTVGGYQRFVREHPDSRFIAQVQKCIVDLEVDAIMSGKHGKLPPPRRIGRAVARSYAVLNVHNDTAYSLTVRYSGPDSFKTVFKTQEKGSLEVLAGRYRVAASVNAAHVRNYAGARSVRGANYQSRYYIAGSFSLPSIHIPSITMGKPKPFVRWPTKRKLPSRAK